MVLRDSTKGGRINCILLSKGLGNRAGDLPTKKLGAPLSYSRRLSHYGMWEDSINMFFNNWVCRRGVH